MREVSTYTAALIVEVIALLAVIAGLDLGLGGSDLDSCLRHRRTISWAIVTALLEGLAHLATARDLAVDRVDPTEPVAHALFEVSAAFLAVGAGEDGVDVGVVSRGVLGSHERSGCDHGRGRGGEKEGDELHDERSV